MTTKPMRIGLLSTIDAPLLGYLIRDLLESGCNISLILFDSKVLSEKDHNLHRERTAGMMPPIPLWHFERESIPAYFVNNHNSHLTAHLVRKFGLDLLLNAGTPRILKSELLYAPSIGVINCHPGLLPGYRGCTCVEWAIYFDEQVGNTVHLMTEGIDEGPIVTMEGLEFSTMDNYQDVRYKVYKAGMKLMAQAVSDLYSGRITPDDFIEQGEGKYHNVIEEGKMINVLYKLDTGSYAFQK